MINDVEKINDSEINFLSSSAHSDDNSLLSITFKHDLLKEGSHSVFEQGIKVADVRFEDGCCVVVSHTDRPIVIDQDIHLNSFVFYSKGPVVFKGAVNVSENSSIAAKEVTFDGPVVSKAELSCYAVNALVMNQAVESLGMTIEAESVVQRSGLLLQESCDITAAQFSQENGSETSIGGALRLLCDETKLLGNFDVKQACFIQSKNLTVGQGAHVKLQGKKYISLDTLVCNQNAKLEMLGGSAAENEIRIASESIVSSGALLAVKNSKFISSEIHNHGELTTEGSRCFSKTLDQHAVFKSKNSRWFVEDSFESHGQGVSHIWGDKKTESLFDAKEMILRSGNFSVDRTSLSAAKVYVGASTLHAFSSEFKVLDSLFAQKESNVALNDSTFVANHKLFFMGALSADNHCKLIAHEHLAVQGAYRIVDSKMISGGRVDFSGQPVSLVRSEIAGQDVTLSHFFNAEGVGIRASKHLDFVSGQITKGKLSARSLRLNGSADPKKPVVFNQCTMVADILSESGYVHLKDSALLGVGGESWSHAVSGSIVLERSEFVTNSQIYNYSNGRIGVIDGSHLQAGTLYNVGQVSAKNSSVLAQTLAQRNARFSADASTLTLVKDVFSKNSVFDFKNASRLKASNVYLQGSALNLSGHSSAEVKDSLSVSSHSSLKSQSSAVVTRELFAGGQVDFIKSYLASDALRIYGSFSAQRSSLSLESTLEIARGAILSVQAGSVLAKEKTMISGTLAAKESQLALGKDLHVGSEGTAALEDSKMKAGHMLHDGRLSVKKTKQAKLPAASQAGAAFDKKLDSTVKLKTLVTSPGSKIEGNDLDCEVDSWEHHGDLDMTGVLQAKGDALWNEGSIKAKKYASLGFDTLLNVGGTIAADHLKITTGISANLLGTIQAHTLEQAGFFNFNTGLVSAWSHQNNSLFSFNAGLMLPSLDPEKTLTPAGIFSCMTQGVQIAACALMPEFSAGINFLCATPVLISSAKYAWNNREHCTWERFNNSSWHELADHASKVSTFAVSAYNLGGQVKKYKKYLSQNFSGARYHEAAWKDLGSRLDTQCQTAKNFPGAVSGLRWDSPEISEASGKKIAIGIGKTAAALLGPRFTGRSVYDFNYGAALSHNINESSYCSHHGGLKAASDSVVINSAYLSNSGQIRAGYGTSSLMGRSFYNEGSVYGGSGSYVDYRTVELGGRGLNEHHGWRVTADTLTASSDQLFSSSNLQLKELNHDGQFFVMNKSALEVEKKHVVKAGSEFVVRGGSEANFSSQEIQSGGKAVVENHSVQRVKGSLVVEKDASMEVKDHSGLKSSSLDQAGAVSVQDNSELSLSGHHQAKSGANFSVENNSGAFVQSQTLEGGSRVEVNDHSTQRVEGQWIIQKGAEASAHNNIKESEKGLEITGGFSAQSLDFDGVIKLVDSHVMVDKQASFSGLSKNVVHNGGFKAETILDSSALLYSGDCSIEAKTYQHSGNIQLDRGKGDKSSLYIGAETGYLAGRADMGVGSFNIDRISSGNASSIAFGQSNYRCTDTFDFSTKEHLKLIGQNGNNSNLHLTAASIQFHGTYSTQHDLTLRSTQSDITFYRDVSAKNVVVDSAGGVDNHGAAIGASQKLLFQVRNGNITNYAGYLSGGTYTQLVASGNISNICSEISYQGAHSVMKQYRPGVISGGAGTTDSKGIGLYVKAGGRVLNDGSMMMSTGDNYIDGEQGVEFKARQHTYVSNEYTQRRSLGKKIHVVETDTQVQGAALMAGGKNIVRSNSGSINAVATAFMSTQGTNLCAKEVKLFSLKAEQTRYEYKRGAFGFSKSQHWEAHEFSTPTLIYDHGVSTIQATNGNVEMRGVSVFGSGDFHVKASEEIIFSRDILNHSSRTKTRSIAPSFFGTNAINTVNHGGNAWQAMAAEDPLLAKGDALMGSKDFAAFAANTWNAGVESFNTAGTLFHGFNEGDFGGALLQRYGLGGSGSFDPTVTFTLSRTETNTNSQSLGHGSIDRTNVTFEAGKKISIDNGADIHARGDASFKATEIEICAAELRSNSSTKTKTVSMGVTASGTVASVGGGQSQARSESTQYANSHIRADGNSRLEADSVSMRGSNIDAQTISGEVKALHVESLQGHKKSSSSNVSASSSGAVAASKSHQESKQVNEVAGIHVREGVNHDGEKFHVGEATLKGAKVTGDGQLNSFADRVTAEDVKDFNKSKSFGVSGNVNDIISLAQKDSQPVDPRAPAIPKVSVSYGSVNQQAVQHATAHGAQGTNLGATEVAGFLNTSNPSGREEIRNSHTNVTLDVPVTSVERIEAASSEISKGWGQLFPEKSRAAILSESIVAPDLKNKDSSEITHEDIVAALDQMSPADRRDLERLINRATQEYHQKGIVSVETEKSLRDKLESSTVLGLKTVGELKFEYVLDRSGGRASKIYVGSKLGGFNFVMNLTLSDEESVNERAKDAAKATAGDYVYMRVLGRVAGASATPVYLVLTGFDIVDSLTYNKDAAQKNITQAVERQGEINKQYQRGELGAWNAGAQGFFAEKQLERAAGRQAFHLMLHPGEAWETISQAGQQKNSSDASSSASPQKLNY